MKTYRHTWIDTSKRHEPVESVETALEWNEFTICAFGSGLFGCQKLLKTAVIYYEDILEVKEAKVVTEPLLSPRQN